MPRSVGAASHLMGQVSAVPGGTEVRERVEWRQGEVFWGRKEAVQDWKGVGTAKEASTTS